GSSPGAEDRRVGSDVPTLRHQNQWWTDQSDGSGSPTQPRGTRLCSSNESSRQGRVHQRCASEESPCLVQSRHGKMVQLQLSRQCSRTQAVRLSGAHTRWQVCQNAPPQLLLRQQE